MGPEEATTNGTGKEIYLTIYPHTGPGTCVCTHTHTHTHPPGENTNDSGTSSGKVLPVCKGGSLLVPEAPVLGESREMRSALYPGSGGEDTVPE